MNHRYRVLWIDAAGEGRFTDLDAEDEAEAAWRAAIMADSSQAQYVNVMPIQADRRP